MVVYRIWMLYHPRSNSSGVFQICQNTNFAIGAFIEMLLFVCVCFHGAYNYSGLVRQVSGLVMSVSVRRVHVVLSTLLDLRAEESRVVRHVKPPRYGAVDFLIIVNSGLHSD